MLRYLQYIWWCSMAVVCTSLSPVMAQSNGIRLTGEFGLSYFFNDPRLPRYLDHAVSTEITYYFSPGKTGFAINPGLGFGINSYHAQLKKGTRLHLEQHHFLVHLRVLTRLRRCFLQMGLVVNYIFGSKIYATFTENTTQSTLSYEEAFLYAPYVPSPIQSAIAPSIGWPLFKRTVLLNLSVVQYVSRMVEVDYIAKEPLSEGDLLAFSTKARPTMLKVSLSFGVKDLRKQREERKKRKREEEES